jgi:hypothetical protein
VKQRKRNVQDRKEEESEDWTVEVNKEVNRNRKERRKGIEKLRRQGKNKEMRDDKNEGWTKEVEGEMKEVGTELKKLGRER